MIPNLSNRQAAIDVAIEHASDQIDATLAHDPGNAQLMIEDLVDAVKGVFLVDERVQ